MRRFRIFSALAVICLPVQRAFGQTQIPTQQKGVMLMNRIGPSASTLYIANADGSEEHPLLATPGFDYHASYSADGRWIVFTSERNGLGQADIYRVRANGTGLERLTDNPALDDQAALSPDGSKVAFVSTRDTHKVAHLRTSCALPRTFCACERTPQRTPSRRGSIRGCLCPSQLLCGT